MKTKRILALCLAALMCTSGANAELKKGDRGGSVLRVQNELYAQGYLSEEGDGLYGGMTENAVKAFQQANGIESTGIVDDLTYEKLVNDKDARARRIIDTLKSLGYTDESEDGASIIRRFQRANGLEMSGVLDDTTLAVIESGKAQKEAVFIQQRLIDLGYLHGKADGDLGPMSIAALKQFQQEHGLEVTGETDEATLSMLFSMGASGNAVRTLQKRLIDLGYLQGKADGDLGPKSIAALKHFQQVHGLEVTGENDAATRDALFSDSARHFYPTLNSASEDADAVKKLQQKLIDLGFLIGKADGDYGAKTYDAVLAFERRMAAQDIDISVDGEADSAMLGILFDGEYTTYTSDVSVGSEGKEANRIERRLTALGYMDAAADEHFDDYAAQCLKAFQSAAGMESAGMADRATVDALFADEAARAEKYVLRDVHLGETSAVMQYAQEALIRMGFLDQHAGLADGVYGEATEAALDNLYAYLSVTNPLHSELFAAKGALTANAVRALMEKDLLSFGSVIDESAEMSEIERVQRRLSGLFFDVSADGIYGDSTKTAVMVFQTINGLDATGIADVETQKKLFSESAVGVWSDFMLKVSIDDQRVYVYMLDDANQYQLINTFICSTGLGDSPETATPLGIFSKTTEPLDRWHYFTEYECWAQYAWRIDGPIYFHSVIFDEKDESTIRMNSVYNLGRKASHGCIRLSVDDAKWIYTNCEAGTIVVIY